MVLVHNIPAMYSQRQLSIMNGTASKKSEKLSSGYRINRSADDAAGLAISEKMRKQIRGLTRASENAEDGISMVQTADGALNEVQEMLQRMNELCVQAANGTNAEMDRRYIQDEVDQLSCEIDRVAKTTKFNETYLLDGSIENPVRSATRMVLDDIKMAEVTKKYEKDKQKELEKFERKRKGLPEKEEKWWEEEGYSIQVLTGENAGKDVTAEELAATEGIKIVYIKDEVVTRPTPGGGDTMAGKDALKKALREEIVPNAVLSIINAYSPAYDFLKGSSIGIGLKLGGNAEIGRGTLAYVGVSWYNYSDGSKVPNMLSYQLAVNMDSLSMDSAGNLSDASRNELEVTIVHEMMHAFMDESLSNGMATNGPERFPQWFIEGMAQTAAGGYYDGNDWVNGSLGINVNSTLGDISIVLAGSPLARASWEPPTQQTPTPYDVIEARYGTGYLASMYLGYLAGGRNLNASSIQAGLGQILGDIRGGQSLGNVITRLTGKASISDFEADFATDGSVLNFIHDLTVLVGNGTGGVVGNLTKPDDILPNDSNPQVTLFQLNVEKDTVTNTYPSGYEVWAGGSTATPGTPGSTTPTGGTVPWDKPASGTGNTPTGTTSPGDKPLEIAAAGRAGKRSGLALHVGTDAEQSNKIMVYIDAMNAKSLGVNKVDVRTEDLATISIERVALALARVSTQRSELGAIQNRLEHTIKNLGNVVENTTASESRIRDTDMAKEMAAYSNANILKQAGQSMLVQTNQSNQGVLNLITG